MRPGSRFLFAIATAQAFVLENRGRKTIAPITILNSLSPCENVCIDAEKAETLEDDTLSELTSSILDSKIGEVGTLSENALDRVFPLILTWSTAETADAAEAIESLLERLEREMENGNELVSLTNKHYTIAIDAWGKSGHQDAARRAENILEKMEKISKLNPAVAPTRVTYNALMNAHSKNGNVDRISELLGVMEDMPALSPITNDYNILLSAHAKLGEARKAELVVQRMVSRSQGSDQSCEPDLYSYNMLLDAWSRSKEPNRGKRAEAILDHLCRHSEFEWDIDVRTYSAAICAVVRSDEKNILERSERILAQAKSNGIDSDVYLESILLDAYASSDSPDAARRAEELLNKLDEEGVANTVTFNTVIKAWKNSNDPSAPFHAEKIVSRMKQLGIVDTISYSTLIAVHANTGDRESAERAEKIIDEMHAMDLAPDIQALNAERMEKGYYGGEVKVIPSVVSFTTLMNGWAKSNDPTSVEKTEEIFHKMMLMHKAGSVDVRPNSFTFVTMINCIVRSRQPGAAEKAERILFDMYDQYRRGNKDVKPNTKLVTAVIDCWQRSGERNAGERAEALLDWLIEVYTVDGDESLSPNEYSFTSAISAWAKTRKFGKALRARAVLAKMIQMHKSGAIKAAPNTHSYTAVINSCAYCENDTLEKRDALQIAIKTYKELENSEYGQPNNVTFSTLITALRHLMPASNKRDAAIKTIFHRCAEDGQVTDTILRRLKSTLSASQLQELVGIHAVSPDGQVYIDKVPDEWKRNVR
eukprot:scaffold22549_cov98-Cylindrotheca_fusiformis.AAC.3